MRRYRFCWSWIGWGGIFLRRLDGKLFCNWFIERPPWPNAHDLRLQIGAGAFGVLVFQRVGTPCEDMRL